MYSDPFLYSPRTVLLGASCSLHLGGAEVDGHYGLSRSEGPRHVDWMTCVAPWWVEQGETLPQSRMTRTMYPLETTAESGTVCAERSFSAAPTKPHFDGEFFDLGAFYGRPKGCQENSRHLQ